MRCDYKKRNAFSERPVVEHRPRFWSHRSMRQSDLDEFSSDAVECPTCGRTDFQNRSGMKIHHAKKHGESIAGVDVKCGVCGDTKRISSYEANSHERHFCSDECERVWRSEYYSGSNHPCWSENTIECDNCGEDFHRRPSHVSETNFCSWECNSQWLSENATGEKSNLWNGGSVVVECDDCGEEIERKKSHSAPPNFCDSNCFGRWQSANNCGQNNPAWKGGSTVYYSLLRLLPPDSAWHRLAEETRRKYEYECEMCGRDESELGRSLDVHHIVPLLSGGDNGEYNRIALCIKCHNKAEGYTSDLFNEVYVE